VALRAVSPTPSRSPERERLAEMIERARAADARRAALARALQTAERAVLTANATVETAQAGIEEAKNATSAHLVAVASGATDDPPKTIREARDRLQDAEDARDAAQSARAALRTQQAAGDNLDIYRMQLREAAAAVLKSEWQGKADAMVSEITTTLDRSIEQAELVRRLADSGLFPTARNSRNQIVGEVGHVCRLSDQELIPDADKARARGAAKFAAMMDALTADADAALP
jgi:hypothetical protein